MEITLIDKVKEVEIKSGSPLEIDITEIFKLAERGRAIKDVNDPEFPIVKREMQKARKVITEYFKDAREEFNRMSKGIIEVQNTVLNEFTPEEDRLIAMDKAEKERLIKEARLATLPARKERMDSYGFEYSDEYLLSFEDADFELMFAKRVADKAEADRIAAEAKLAEERAAFEAEQAEVKRKERELAERVMNLRIQSLIEIGLRFNGEAYVKDDMNVSPVELSTLNDEEFTVLVAKLKTENDRREKVKVEEAEKARQAEIKAAEEAAAAKAKKDAEEAEAKRVAEEEARKKAVEEAEAKAEAARQADAKYQKFLSDNGFNAETDALIEDEDSTGRITILYREISRFTHN